MELPLTTEVNLRSLASSIDQLDAITAQVQTLTGSIPYVQERKIDASSQEAVAIGADGVLPVANPIDAGLGWYFKNTGGSPEKANWYFLGQDANQTKTFGDIDTLYAVLKIYVNASQQSLPYLSLYSKPEGVGDAAGWYHSRRTWVISAADAATISNGDTVLIYKGDDPADVEPGIPHLALEIDPISSNGDDDPAQQILLLALSSDSGAPAAQVEIACPEFGTYVGGDNQKRILA